MFYFLIQFSFFSSNMISYVVVISSWYSLYLLFLLVISYRIFLRSYSSYSKNQNSDQKTKDQNEKYINQFERILIWQKKLSWGVIIFIEIKNHFLTRYEMHYSVQKHRKKNFLGKIEITSQINAKIIWWCINFYTKICAILMQFLFLVTSSKFDQMTFIKIYLSDYSKHLILLFLFIVRIERFFFFFIIEITEIWMIPNLLFYIHWLICSHLSI